MSIFKLHRDHKIAEINTNGWNLLNKYVNADGHRNVSERNS